MKHFNWTQFTKRIGINTDMQTAYNAWTQSGLLEKWFLSEAAFYTETDSKMDPETNAEAGNRYEWSWFAQSGSEHGTVIQANGRDLIEFTFAGDCKVEVRLKEEAGQVLVELMQKEIPPDDDSKENIRLGCAFGWTFYLVNLKSVLEGGLDLRNKDTTLIGMVNN